MHFFSSHPKADWWTGRTIEYWTGQTQSGNSSIWTFLSSAPLLFSIVRCPEWKYQFYRRSNQLLEMQISSYGLIVPYCLHLSTEHNGCKNRKKQGLETEEQQQNYCGWWTISRTFFPFRMHAWYELQNDQHQRMHRESSYVELKKKKTRLVISSSSL